MRERTQKTRKSRTPVRSERRRPRTACTAPRKSLRTPPSFTLPARPAAARACREVRYLAPLLSTLIYDPVVPEKPLHMLLEWADDLAAQDSPEALALPRLRAVLPQMVTAFIASHDYSLERAAGRAGNDRLVLHDRGNGAVVGRIMMLLTEVIAPAHGDDGRALGEASRGDLAAGLFRIAARIETW